MNLNRELLRQHHLQQWLLKAQEGGFETLLRKLESIYRQTAGTALEPILRAVTARLRAAKDANEAAQAIQELDLSKLALEGVPKKAIDLYELIYLGGVQEGAPKISVSLDLKDQRSLELIGQQNLFWLGEYYSEDLGQQFNELLTRSFSEGWSRQQLAEAMMTEFRDFQAGSSKYYELLADHTARKIREIGRVTGYERAGIEYVKVKAILDHKTSTICRHMHGRIIPVSKLAAQRADILTAEGKEGLRQAQRWIEDYHGPTSSLPRGVALPPYHYRCRTVTVAYFANLDDIGRGYQYWNGEERVKETVAVQVLDESMGRELLTTDERLKAMRLSRKEAKRELQNIVSYGMSEAGELLALTSDGNCLIFAQNVMVSIKDATYFQAQAKDVVVT